MKKLNLAAVALACASLLAALAVSAPSQAQDGPDGPPPPPQMRGGDGPDGPPPGHHEGPPPSLTQEQRELRRQIVNEHREKSRPVREDLRDQKLIYDALRSNPNASADDIRKVVADMRKLRDQLNALREEMKAKFRSSGLPEWSFRGMGDRRAGSKRGGPCWDRWRDGGPGWHGRDGGPGWHGRDWRHGDGHPPWRDGPDGGPGPDGGQGGGRG
ncbi:MAG: periplasmic heavy metal sensor [Deltaproteobacteria bacterium]|jgi:Spy/CpxP family protein refolding chaperone|nr:periplasmic heavy metal sensor [Deltaproteobacteria bacterium]